MKESVHIKVELYPGQHDALIDFYNSYPRMFVNKLLMKLCEACMPKFPPKLGQFATNKSPGGSKPRNVSITIRSAETPVFWDFYQGLPYGAKASFIVNLMNHYVTLAEADRKLLDNLYWTGDANNPPAAALQEDRDVVAPVGKGGGSEPAAVVGADVPERPAKPLNQSASTPAEVAADTREQVSADPLTLHDTGLM